MGQDGGEPASTSAVPGTGHALSRSQSHSSIDAAIFYCRMKKRVQSVSDSLKEQLLSGATAFKPSLPASEIFPPVLHPGKLGESETSTVLARRPGSYCSAATMPCSLARCIFAPRLVRRKYSFLGSQQFTHPVSFPPTFPHEDSSALPSLAEKEGGVEWGKALGLYRAYLRPALGLLSNIRKS